MHLPRDRANRGNFSLFDKHVTRFPVYNNVNVVVQFRKH